jgi:hypothetical protein
MLRSDFHAVYARLLAREARTALEWLFTTAKGQVVPPSMAALGMTDPLKPVFAHPYRHADPAASPQAGPSIKAWLESIIHGRGRGAFMKDLLSPPPGYPLHSGVLQRDYGMGAMGVDEANGMLLIEWRGAPYRPEKVPMNGQIARAVLHEYGRATALNPTLQTSRRGAVRSAKFQLLDDLEKAFDGMSSSLTTLAARGDALSSGNWRLLERALKAQLTDLDRLRARVVARTNSAWAPGIAGRIDDLDRAARDLMAEAETWSTAAAVLAKLPAVKAALAGLEAALWDAGRKTM